MIKSLEFLQEERKKSKTTGRQNQNAILYDFITEDFILDQSPGCIMIIRINIDFKFPL